MFAINHDRVDREAIRFKENVFALDLRIDDFRNLLLAGKVNDLCCLVRFFNVLQPDLHIHGTCRLQLISVCADKADVKKPNIGKVFHIGIDLISSLFGILIVRLIVGENLLDLDLGVRGNAGLCIIGHGNDIVLALCLQRHGPVHCVRGFRFLNGRLCRRFGCCRLLSFRLLCAFDCFFYSFNGLFCCRISSFFHLICFRRLNRSFLCNIFRDILYRRLDLLLFSRHADCFHSRLRLFISDCLSRKGVGRQHRDRHDCCEDSRENPFSDFHEFSFTFLVTTVSNKFLPGLDAPRSFFPALCHFRHIRKYEAKIKPWQRNCLLHRQFFTFNCYHSTTHLVKPFSQQLSPILFALWLLNTKSVKVRSSVIL